MDEIIYSKRIFAFLDILGFKRIIEESRRKPEIITNITNILKLSKKIAVSSLTAKLKILQVEPSQYMYRAFSDTSANGYRKL